VDLEDHQGIAPEYVNGTSMSQLDLSKGKVRSDINSSNQGPRTGKS